MKKETAEQTQRRHQREMRELARLKKSAAKPSLVHGFWFLLVVLTIIYIADEISSNMNGIMRTYTIFDLFKVPNSDPNTPEYSNAISVLAIATIPSYLITAINPLYRTLADRFGRKIFLFINTLGMGIGLLVAMIAPNPYIYIVGVCITAFFTPNDMQVIYLMETAPIEHRAKLCSITKGIGLLSVSLIGVFRSMFYNPADVTTWRMVYLIPAIIAIAIAIVAWLFTRETPVFLQKRIAWLEKSDEDRRKEEEAGNSQKSSIGEAVRYIVHSKQLRMVVIVLFVFSMGIAFSGYTNEIMLAGGHMTDGLRPTRSAGRIPACSLASWRFSDSACLSSARRSESDLLRSHWPTASCSAACGRSRTCSSWCCPVNPPRPASARRSWRSSPMPISPT